MLIKYLSKISKQLDMGRKTYIFSPFVFELLVAMVTAGILVVSAGKLMTSLDRQKSHKQIVCENRREQFGRWQTSLTAAHCHFLANLKYVIVVITCIICPQHV